jgi:hypothetical protein
MQRLLNDSASVYHRELRLHHDAYFYLFYPLRDAM